MAMENKKIYFITGADRGLGFSLCKLLLEKGNIVFAGQYMREWKALSCLQEEYPDSLVCIPFNVTDMDQIKEAAATVVRFTNHIDVLVNCAGINGQIRDIREGYDYERMLNVLNVNALGPIRVVEAFLPLLSAGDRKIWCVSSEAGSIGECWRKDETEYCMSKAALNMGIQILHNLLHKEDYEFRLYHPGWMNTYMTGSKETKADLDPDIAAKLLLKQLQHEKVKDTLYLEGYDGKIWSW